MPESCAGDEAGPMGSQEGAGLVGTIFSFPEARLNPYSNMLYLAAQADGWKVRYSSRPEDLYRHLGESASTDIVHVQWNWPFFSPQSTGDAVKAELATFFERLDAALARGVSLVWTVHNLQSHDAVHAELEHGFHQGILNRAKRVVVLNEETPKLLADHGYQVDARSIALVPHSSYAGVYPSTVSQLGARERLGIDPGSKVVGLVGQLRPYKGLDALIEAMGRLGNSQPASTLMIAGRANEATRAEIEDLAQQNHVELVASFDFIANEDLQNWCKASDVLAFPYRNILNSGSAYLAATMGRTCILPRIPQFTSLYSAQDWVKMYDTDRNGALTEVLAESLLTSDADGLKAWEYAQQNPPFQMSLTFLRAIQGRA